MSFMDDKEDTNSLVGADYGSEVEEVKENTKTSPKFSKAFLEFLEDTFDIRKSIYYEDSIEKLKGVQEVLTYLRMLYNNNFKLN